MASFKGWYEERPCLPPPTSHTAGIRLFTYISYTHNPLLVLHSISWHYLGEWILWHPHEHSLTWLISQQLSKINKPVSSFAHVPADGGDSGVSETRVSWRGTTPADTIFSHPQLCPPWPTVCLTFSARLLEQGAERCLATLQHDKILSTEDRSCREGRTEVAEIRLCSPSSSGSTGPRGSGVAVIDVHPMSVTDMQSRTLSAPFPSEKCSCRQQTAEQGEGVWDVISLQLGPSKPAQLTRSCSCSASGEIRLYCFYSKCTANPLWKAKGGNKATKEVPMGFFLCRGSFWVIRSWSMNLHPHPTTMGTIFSESQKYWPRDCRLLLLGSCRS